MDIIPFYLCVGTYEPRCYHGVVARLVVRECRFYYMKPLSVISGADSGWNSCRSSTTSSTRICPSLRPP